MNTIMAGATQGAGVFTDLAADSPLVTELSATRIGGRIGRPSDVADAAEYLAGDLAAWVSGHNLVLSGGPPR